MIEIVYGSNNLYNDVQKLYLQKFEQANNKSKTLDNNADKVSSILDELKPSKLIEMRKEGQNQVALFLFNEIEYKLSKIKQIV